MVPQLHRGLSQVREHPQGQGGIRLPAGKGKHHISLRPEDGVGPVQPVRVFKKFRVALRPPVFPGAGEIPPGIGGVDDGLQGLLSAGIGEGRGRFGGNAGIPEGFKVRQQLFSRPLSQGAPQGPAVPYVPVPPQVEAQGTVLSRPDQRPTRQGDHRKVLSGDRLRILRGDLGQLPVIRTK